MQQPVTISTQKRENPAFDYEELRKIGIEHIENTASSIWTDYNIHDPGITSLELLCYAITDLSYRANYPIPDLLATKENTVQNTRQQFFSAKQIFPNKAVTINDYRKLLIDIEGVKNAWLTKRTKQIFADIINKKLTHLQPESRKWETVDIKGYYNVLLEYDTNIQEDEKEPIRNEVREVLQANRNLCEDFINIDEVTKQEFRLCSEIEIKPGANPFDTLAQIFFNIQLYLTPLIKFYSLKELIDEKITTDKIFEGPLLTHGFIKESDLKASELKTEIHLSDIMREILKVDAAVNILDILFLPIDSANTSSDKCNKWVVEVEEGRQPVLNIAESNVLLYKGGIPFRPTLSDLGQVKTKFDELMLNYILGNDLVRTEDVDYPTGTFQNIEEYYSIQNDYPKNYGISHWGLPADAADERKMQAKQLQAYLLFFDQQLANYLSQLSHVRNLFSIENEQQTYFTQVVRSLNGVNDLFANPLTIDNKIQEAAEIRGSDEFYNRRNLFLNHLLSRFAESFFDYVNILNAIFPYSSPRDIIDTKINFLKNYPAHSAQRFSAYNYANADQLWNTDNISGLERRLESLLGFKNIQRRNLINIYTVIQHAVNEANTEEFWFEIIDSRTGKILLKASENSQSEETGKNNLNDALELSGNEENFAFIEDQTDQTFIYQLKDSAGKIVGVSNDHYPSLQEAQSDLTNLITLFSANQSEEGMFLIEHLLLLPEMNSLFIESPLSPIEPQQDDDKGFMPICVDENCMDCDTRDLYSFRISIILPAYAPRFLDIDFRRYCERVIRTEIPAHIYPKICWVNNEDMQKLEIAYHNWLEVKAGIKEDADNEILEQFITILTTVKTIYPVARLEDCASDEERKLFLLNQNALGTLKT